MPVDSAHRIGDLIAAEGRSFSFEFSPPKDAEGEEVLWRSIGELEPLRPTFVSVTYGAGGGNRDRVVEITGRIARETSMLPMAHLACVRHTQDELARVLDDIWSAGVRNVLALRGDPEAGPGTAWVSTPGGFDRTTDLVGFIREHGDFSVGVAAFPEGHLEAESLEADAAVLKAKQDAGATFAITDMVLRFSDYVGLVERARAAGVTIPIVPGLMPILNLRSMARMVELSGRDMPEETLARLEPVRDDPAAVRAEGITMTTELADDLLAAGAPGLHFYTLNRSKATREIYAGLSEAV